MTLTFQTSDSSNHSIGSIRITSIVNYIPWFWHKGYKRSAVDSITSSVYKCWDCPGMRWQLIDISHTKMKVRHSMLLNTLWVWLSLQHFLLSKWQNSKIQKKQRGSEQGEKGVWEWKEEHGTEDVKREGSLQWTEGGMRMKRETHRKVGHTLIPPCTVVYLCACALLDWIPQYLGGFWWCIPSTQPAHWALLTLSTKLFMEAREWKDCSLFPLFHYISSWLL